MGRLPRAGLPRRDEVLLQSRDEKPLARYFPELLEPLAKNLPARCVLDGEIVIAGERGLEFEALLLRIHPAASRVAKLAQREASVLRRLGSPGARR